MKSGVQMAGKVAKSLARFIEPMECLPVPKLPTGGGWLYEIKLDGWRLESVKTGGKVVLYSRRGKSFNSQFRDIGVPGKFCTSGSETNWYGRSMEWPRPGSTRLSRL